MWYFAQNCKSDARLDGKTALITGGNTGIGKITAKEFYKRGARVVILCRDQERAKTAIEEIKLECETLTDVGEFAQKYLDLSELATVRSCAEDILREEGQIHLLVNNAGVMLHPGRWTKDGFEVHFGVNYLGHFLLTLLLLPRMINSGYARIINVSSVIHKYPYFGHKIYLNDLNFKNQRYSQLIAYAQSKLANILFTKELARRLKAANISNVTVYSLHPGIIYTELGRTFDSYIPGLTWLWNNIYSWFSLTPEQGAQTTLHCALDEKLTSESGLYYSNCAVANPSSVALDEDKAKRLWDISLKMVNFEDCDLFNSDEID